MNQTRRIMHTLGVWLFSLSLVVPVIQSVVDDSTSITWVEEMDKGEGEGEKEIKDKKVKDSKICLTGKEFNLDDQSVGGEHNHEFAEGDDFTWKHDTPPELV